MSDRPLSERVMLRHAPACPSFETDGDECTCGAEQERQQIAALEAALTQIREIADGKSERPYDGYHAIWSIARAALEEGGDDE